MQGARTRTSAGKDVARGARGLCAAVAGVTLAALPCACTALMPLDGLTGTVDDAGEGVDSPGFSTDDAGGRPVGEDGGPGGSRVDGGGGVDAPAGGDSSQSMQDAQSSPDEGTGSQPDSSTIPDAGEGKDAPAEAAPVLGYCAGLSPAPLFCDDFDEGALAASWDQVSGTNGHASLDSTYSVSPPNAMLSSVTAKASSSVDVAGYKTFAAKENVSGTYTLAFDVRVDAADTSSASDGVLAAILLYDAQSSSNVWALELEVSYASGNVSASLTEDGSSSTGSTTDYVQHGASASLPMGAWTRVSLVLALTASSSSAPASMSFGGTQVASATVDVTTTTDPVPEIIIGPTYASSASNGWLVRYDNVTFN